MTTNLIDGLTISLIVTIASVVLIPLFCWALPHRSAKTHVSG